MPAVRHEQSRSFGPHHHRHHHHRHLAFSFCLNAAVRIVAVGILSGTKSVLQGRTTGCLQTTQIMARFLCHNPKNLDHITNVSPHFISVNSERLDCANQLLIFRLSKGPLMFRAASICRHNPEGLDQTANYFLPAYPGRSSARCGLLGPPSTLPDHLWPTLAIRKKHIFRKPYRST